MFVFSNVKEIKALLYKPVRYFVVPAKLFGDATIPFGHPACRLAHQDPGSEPRLAPRSVSVVTWMSHGANLTESDPTFNLLKTYGLSL
jgi:hypothetical protein